MPLTGVDRAGKRSARETSVIAQKVGGNSGQGRGSGEISPTARGGAGAGVPLESKLHAPPVRREWVARPGLVRFLGQSSAKLVLLAAPAGYGKTTLLAQWCSARSEGGAFGWISLSPEDNDPIALWQLVVHALARACPTLGGEGLLRALHDQNADPTGQFLPMLANELSALSGR